MHSVAARERGAAAKGEFKGNARKERGKNGRRGEGEKDRERGALRVGNIQTPFFKLSIATQRDLNGDGRGPIREGGPNRAHPLFFYLLSSSRSSNSNSLKSNGSRRDDPIRVLLISYFRHRSGYSPSYY